MNRQSILSIALIASLALATACGDSTDPASGDNNGGNNGGNNGANNGGNNGANNGGNNGGNNGSGCEENLTYVGQVFTAAEPDPLSPNGGTPTTDPYGADYDCGIGAALAAVPTSSDEGMNTADVDIALTGCTVTATFYNTANQPVPRANREFWLQDGQGAIKVFFPAGEDENDPIRANHATFNIKVGQKVSVSISQLQNYNGLPEVTGVAEGTWALVSENNPVSIWDATGSDLMAGDVAKLVRITGKLSTASTDCGGQAKCYEFDHGAANLVVLRTSSQFVEGGQCATFVGPLGFFAGTLQLDAANFDWLWTNN